MSAPLKTSADIVSPETFVSGAVWSSFFSTLSKEAAIRPVTSSSKWMPKVKAPKQSRYRFQATVKPVAGSTPPPVTGSLANKAGAGQSGGASGASLAPVPPPVR